MKMMNRLIGIRTAVDNASKSGVFDSLSRRNARRRQAQLTEKIRVVLGCIRETDKMPAWNDEHVDGRLGVDIAKCQHIRILVDDVRRNFPEGNLAKETIRHGSV